MAVRYNKAPFPWFGGKSKAAPLVWSLLGDVVHYVEPFAGALGVLLERPHPCNRPYYSETINDLDGLVVNAWRSIQFYPEETAYWASWPVTEYDKRARQIAALKWWHDEKIKELVEGSWDYCCPQIAGFWLYGVCCHIGAVSGSWTADPVTGRIIKVGGDGVKRDRPELGNHGRGVNHADTREPGVSRDLPQLSDNGRGVNNAGIREPGVFRNRPELGNHGRGVNHAGTREPGVLHSRPSLVDHGRGVNRPQLREPGIGGEPEFHPIVMPELLRWFSWLTARLRHVRIVNGDWSRVVTNGAAKTINVRMNGAKAGIFLDPPYDLNVRDERLYQHDTVGLSDRVRQWCIANGDDPDYRIVLAGFDTEHAILESHGWTVHEWFKKGFMTGGMGNIGRKNQQYRERLWASPHCLAPTPPKQERSLFDD